MSAEPIRRISALAAAARHEAQAMTTAVAGQQDERHVRLTVAEFRRLADLLGALGEAGGACGGADCMGATVRGVKLWVTHDHLLRERSAGQAVATADPLLL